MPLSVIATIGLTSCSCCDEQSKILQASTGEDAASRAVWTARVGDATSSGDVGIVSIGDEGVVLGASVRGDVKIAGASLPANRAEDLGQNAAAADDILVVKLSSLGKPLWGQRFGDARSQRVHDVDATETGTIFVGGRFEGGLAWGKQTWKANDKGYAGFVATLDPSGVPGWGTWFDAVPAPKTRDEPCGATVLAVESDDLGRLFVMGSYRGIFRIEGKPPIADADDRTGGTFFARFDSAGALRWFRLASQSEQTLQSRVDAMATSHTGDIVLTGVATGKGSFVDVPLDAGKSSVVITVWDQTGNAMWARSFGLDGTVDRTRVAVSKGGDVYVAAELKGTLVVDKTKVEATPGGEGSVPLVVMRVDPKGEARWVKRLGNVSASAPFDVAADGAEGFVVTATVGVAGGKDDLGGTVFEEVKPGVEGGVVVAAFDGEGSARWSRAFATEQRNRSGGVTVTKDGRVLVAGILNAGICEPECEQKQLGDLFVAAMRK